MCMEREYTSVAEEYGGNQGRLYSAGRSKTAKPSGDFTKKELFQWIKVLACAFLFLTMVLTKVNMPEQFAQLRENIVLRTQHTIDYVDVFYSLGKAVSGEESVRQTMNHVYMEVFQPDKGMAGVTETAITVPVEIIEQPEDIKDMPQENREEKADEAAKQEEGETEEKGEAAAVLEEAVPEGICMEQKILNLSYTTPVSGWLSSPFGYREHPVAGEEKFHRGIDIAAIEGSAISAFAEGKVSAVGESSSLGNYVMIRHENDLTTIYGHCSKITTKEGKEVVAGEKIAEVGHTGLATGDHLHFAIRQGDTYLNPIYYVELDELV